MKKHEAHTASLDMEREIDDLQKEVPRLQASESTVAGTWRCEERLKALRSQHKDNKRPES
jgi:hypothetical protein